MLNQPPPEYDEAHDAIYALMMDAIDGNLDAVGEAELASQLTAHPELAQEWGAWQEVDALFRSTPVLMPAADFTANTLDMLPDPRQRLGVIAAVYGALLLIGAIPLLLIVWGLGLLVPVLNDPTITSGAGVVIADALRVVQLLVTSVFGGAAGFVQAHPYTLGWLFVMLGVIFVWNGVYQQMVLTPQRSLS